MITVIIITITIIIKVLIIVIIFKIVTTTSIIILLLIIITIITDRYSKLTKVAIHIVFLIVHSLKKTLFNSVFVRVNFLTLCLTCSDVVIQMCLYHYT